MRTESWVLLGAIVFCVLTCVGAARADDDFTTHPVCTSDHCKLKPAPLPECGHGPVYLDIRAIVECPHDPPLPTLGDDGTWSYGPLGGTAMLNAVYHPPCTGIVRAEKWTDFPTCEGAKRLDR